MNYEFVRLTCDSTAVPGSLTFWKYLNILL